MKAKKNNEALTRTSAFREDRKNYLTESGYTYYRWDEDLKKEVPVNITLGDEFQNADGTTGTIDREILLTPGTSVRNIEIHEMRGGADDDE